MTEPATTFTLPLPAKRLLVDEIATWMHNRSDEDLAIFLSHVVRFVKHYTFGYQLDGRILLVLDNSLIQDFKHSDKPERALNAHAYTAFCRFVRDWSDRETCLALSPVAVYEAMGREVASSPEMAAGALANVIQPLARTGLPFHSLGFTSPDELARHLHDIDHDARFLAEFAQQIKDTNWNIDLRWKFGVRHPIGIAESMIPEDLPLKYFSPDYVRQTFASLISQLITKQSNEHDASLKIDIGQLARDLARLTKLVRGVLKGIGDIDLFQICDGVRQYRQRGKVVCLGQAIDRTLDRVLVQRQIFHERRTMHCGTPQADQQREEVIRFMFSNPFAEQDARLARIDPRAADFMDTVYEGCCEVQRARQ